MDDLAASRERYPLQTMRLPDGEPFAYRYHRNPSARATIVLLPGGIGLSDCSACILNGSSRTARSCCSILPAYLFLMGALENRRFRGPVALVV